MQNLTYRVRTTAIISEIIDGEAIIMDMSSGDYFSTTGVGATIWELATSHNSRTDILDGVASAYPMVPSARQDAATFLDDIEAAGLVVQQPRLDVDSPSPCVSSAAPGLFPKAYECPKLQSHADMKDLIDLDPIHDVSDTGWPIRKETV
jgi:hypothetical protein